MRVGRDLPATLHDGIRAVLVPVAVIARVRAVELPPGDGEHGTGRLSVVILVQHRCILSRVPVRPGILVPYHVLSVGVKAGIDVIEYRPVHGLVHAHG